jgi:hypothetical protein
MVLAGGLQVITSRVVLDVLVWLGFLSAVWTPPHWMNTMTMLSTAITALATSGPTSRWTLTFPMAPLVLLQLLRRMITLFRQNRKINGTADLLIRYSCCFWIVVSIIFSILFPPLALPKAQAGGPYAVGAVRFFVPLSNATTCNDSSSSCGSFGNHSHVQARLLYPTKFLNEEGESSSATMPYLSPSLALEFLRESMKIAGPPPLKTYDWLMHHWLLTELPIQPHAKLLDAGQATAAAFPVVVYSHGLIGSADLYSYQAMSLASQGVLVLMVNHLDGSAPVAERHDGSRIKFDSDIVQLYFDGKKEEYARKCSEKEGQRVRERNN